MYHVFWRRYAQTEGGALDHKGTFATEAEALASVPENIRWAHIAMDTGDDLRLHLVWIDAEQGWVAASELARLHYPD